MIVGDTLFYGFGKSGKISIELRYVILKERLFHRDESVAPLHDIAGIAQCTVGVINVQFEIVELMRFETTFVLSRSSPNHAGNSQRQNSLFHFCLVSI